MNSKKLFTVNLTLTTKNRQLMYKSFFLKTIESVHKRAVLFKPLCILYF